MFSTYRALNPVEPDDDCLYYGLSAPFPVSGEKMLEQVLKTCKLSSLDLVFVGFFDPLMQAFTDGEMNGGFTSVRKLVAVDSAVSFRDCLFSLARNRGISLLYSVESQKEGE